MDDFQARVNQTGFSNFLGNQVNFREPHFDSSLEHFFQDNGPRNQLIGLQNQPRPVLEAKKIWKQLYFFNKWVRNGFCLAPSEETTRKFTLATLRSNFHLIFQNKKIEKELKELKLLAIFGIVSNKSRGFLILFTQKGSFGFWRQI